MAESDNPFLRAKRSEEATRAAITGDIREMGNWLSILTEAIQAGGMDDELPKIAEAIQNRKEAQREEVLKLVKQTFGEGAEVTVKRVGPQFATPAPRGLFEKTEDAPDETEAAASEKEDGATADPLSHLDEVEARMESEVDSDPEPPSAEQPYIPPERRGAVISGLHPSDMGD